MEDKKAHLPLSVDIGAKAELKAEFKAEVPQSSMGRLVDGSTDAIRPFTKRRCLRFDQIRLQREEVLIKIAHKARERVSIEAAEIRPIPNKALVPFLEKASLEDGSDR